MKGKYPKLSIRLILLKWFFMALIVLWIIAGCATTSSKWVPLSDKDFDIIRFDPKSNSLWASDLGAEKIYQLTPEQNGAHPINAFPLPPGHALMDLCVSGAGDVYVVSQNKILNFLPDRSAWRNLISMDSITACKSMIDQSVLFFGTQNGESRLLIRENEKFSVMGLVPGWTDIVRDDQGITWLISGDKGLFNLDSNNGWVRQNDITGLRLFATTPNTLWIETEQGLFVLSNAEKNKQPQLVMGGKPKLTGDVYQTANGLLIIVAENGIWEVRGSKMTQVPLPLKVRVIGIKSGFDPISATLFVTTDEGLYSYSGFESK